jgi:glucokinase
VILVGDIGGTNARFALARRGGDGWHLSDLTGTDGSLKLTNTGCTLEPGTLGRAARTTHVTLVNDFFAVAHAIPQLRNGQLRACGDAPVPTARKSCWVRAPGSALRRWCRRQGRRGRCCRVKAAMPIWRRSTTKPSTCGRD